jgi:hypothetical protein
MPIERQLDVYIAGVTAIHPPRIDLGLVIGEQGPVILPALFDRLGREEHGCRQARLVWIMVGMPCAPDVRPQVLEALDSMRIHVWASEDSAHRARAERSLRHYQFTSSVICVAPCSSPQFASSTISSRSRMNSSFTGSIRLAPFS